MSSTHTTNSAGNSSDSQLVLVTGATGYIASCLVKQLAEAGDYRLRCTVRSLENNQKLEALKRVLEGCKTQPEFVKADLLQSADQWKSVVAGCDYVLHTASPFPLEVPSDPDLIIKPAVEGTLSVLDACAEAGTVKRVVITSSCAAIFETEAKPDKIWTEEDWPDIAKLSNAYSKSKPLAEKAAWEFVRQLPDEKKFELVALNPGLVLGVPVIKSSSASIDIVKSILNREWPMIPPMSVPVVDLKDVVQAHIKAIKNPGAAGHRHILAEQTCWFRDLADILADEFNPKGFSVARRAIPGFIITIASIFSSTAATVCHEMNSFPIMDNTRMRMVLEIEPQPIKKSLVEMGEELIKLGIVPKPYTL